MSPVLVDSSVILDVASADPTWGDWSASALERAADEAPLVINALVFAEVSVGFERMEEVDDLISPDRFRREPLPYEAAFLAGRVFVAYRRRKGAKTSPMPDFYIGAHAAVAGYRLLTRDTRRFRTYFPALEIIAP